jgi:serine/threonine protein kinase
MPLPPGSKLGPYEILNAIGAGGMGEVYKARDPRLNRIVAIKVLPAHLADRAEIRERFEREARTVAGLNHPHICVLHDIGRQDSIDYLVMEYLEGGTLAERLAKGPLPMPQVLEFAIQIADALDKAHRKGVTHRDLKPGNVMLAPNGTKLVDFGLAKLKAAGSPAAAVTPGLVHGSAPETKTEPLTEYGTVMGTFQYMAPEQLEGKNDEIDGRSDIFSFGALIYEMATGAKAFEGKSHASLSAAILEREPPSMSAIQPLTPAPLERVVRKCLAKAPDKRWQSASDLCDELKWITDAPASAPQATPPPPPRPNTRERIIWASLAIAFAVSVWLGFRSSQPTAAPAPTETVRLSVVTPETSNPFDFALSPDGRSLAYVADSENGRPLLWVRPLNATTAQPLAGTEDAVQPFWSPDSLNIAFFAGGKLKKIALSGGAPQNICDAGNGRGGTWNRDGVILFSWSTNDGLFRVSAAGGEVTRVTSLDPKTETSHRWAQFLPDGKHFLFFSQSAKAPSIAMGSLDSKETRRLVDTNFRSSYVRTGYLLFVRDGVLMAQAFQPEREELSGEPIRLADGLDVDIINRAAFSASDSGILAYRSSTLGLNTVLAWFDRTGKRLGTVGPAGQHHQNPELSPDGRQVVYNRLDLRTGQTDVWVLDLAGGEPRRLTFDPGLKLIPRWSPDGGRVIYQSNRDGPFSLYQKSSNGGGTEDLLIPGLGGVTLMDWSKDGRFVAYGVQDQRGNTQLVVQPVFGDRKPMFYPATGATHQHARLSPDGKWIAYVSNESGKYEVYVQTFPPGGGKWQVSTNGGVMPRWRRDGKELFYVALDRKIMAAEVRSGSSIEFGNRTALFEAKLYGGLNVAGGWNNQYDVSPDGQRFLLNTEAAASAVPITVVLNWAAELKR